MPYFWLSMKPCFFSSIVGVSTSGSCRLGFDRGGKLLFHGGLGRFTVLVGCEPKVAACDKVDGFHRVNTPISSGNGQRMIIAIAARIRNISTITNLFFLLDN